MKELHQKSIDEIMECFDFAKVESVMISISWGWYDGTGISIPSINDLKGLALRLLTDCAEAKHNNYYTGTGGLWAEKINSDYFSLKFVLTEWDNFGDEKIEDEVELQASKERHSSPFTGLEL